MFDFVYDYPTWPMMLVFGTISVAVTVALLFIARPTVHQWNTDEPRTNEMIGFFMSAFSMIYGLLLGLLAVAAYTNFSVVSDLTTEESAALAGLYRDISQFPEPIRTELQDFLRSYTKNIIAVDWPAQQKGETPNLYSLQLDNMFATIAQFQPTTIGQEVVMSETFSQLNVVAEHRRKRLAAAGTAIPNLLWVVVLLGATINVLLLVLLEMKFWVHVVLASLVAGYFGIVIFFVAAMDKPFQGEVSIDSQIYQTLIDTQM